MTTHRTRHISSDRVPSSSDSSSSDDSHNGRPSRPTSTSRPSRAEATKSVRARRPTPIVRRSYLSNRTRPVHDNEFYAEDSDDDFDYIERDAVEETVPIRNVDRHPITGSNPASILANAGRASNSNNSRNNRRVSVRLATARRRPNDIRRWYDCLLPDCVLELTSPLTGYEARIDPGVGDDEYDILERERLRRNIRIRRRLLTVMLVAAAAGAFYYARGRWIRSYRPTDVRTAMSSMARKLEDGLSKTMIDKMGPK